MISRETGLIISSEIKSIEQSITDILTTPIGSRLMRGEYGSIIPDLIDQPTNDVLIVKIYSAIYTSLSRWEKRISLDSLNISELRPGVLQLDLDAVHTISGQSLNLNIPLQMGALT